jgi:hypothetical protein
VNLVWTREEEIQHDMHRPCWFDRISAGLDERGCRSPGTIASRAPRSSPDGPRRYSRTGPTPTPRRAQST